MGIAWILFPFILAIICMYNAVTCDKFRLRCKKYGKLYPAKILHWQERKEYSGGKIRGSYVTWYDIDVEITDGADSEIRTIRTTNRKAEKYRDSEQAEVLVLSEKGNVKSAEKILIKEDVKTSAETLLSLALFVVFAVGFVMGIVSAISKG